MTTIVSFYVPRRACRVGMLEEHEITANRCRRDKVVRAVQAMQDTRRQTRRIPRELTADECESFRINTPDNISLVNEKTRFFLKK